MTDKLSERVIGITFRKSQRFRRIRTLAAFGQNVSVRVISICDFRAVGEGYLFDEIRRRRVSVRVRYRAAHIFVCRAYFASASNFFENFRNGSSESVRRRGLFKNSRRIFCVLDVIQPRCYGVFFGRYLVTELDGAEFVAESYFFFVFFSRADSQKRFVFNGICSVCILEFRRNGISVLVISVKIPGIHSVYPHFFEKPVGVICIYIPFAASICIIRHLLNFVKSIVRISDRASVRICYFCYFIAVIFI